MGHQPPSGPCRSKFFISPLPFYDAALLTLKEPVSIHLKIARKTRCQHSWKRREGKTRPPVCESLSIYWNQTFTALQCRPQGVIFLAKPHSWGVSP
eukprot:502392-Pelagomonas_calceolata.AAC.4